MEHSHFNFLAQKSHTVSIPELEFPTSRINACILAVWWNGSVVFFWQRKLWAEHITDWHCQKARDPCQRTDGHALSLLVQVEYPLSEMLGTEVFRIERGQVGIFSYT
jgi:hypothetical protein